MAALRPLVVATLDEVEVAAFDLSRQGLRVVNRDHDVIPRPINIHATAVRGVRIE